MAEEEEKTTVDTGDAAGDGEKQGGSNIILLGGIGLAAIVIGVVLALFVIRPMLSDSGDEAAVDNSNRTEQTSGHGEAKETPKRKPRSTSHGDGARQGSLVYAIQDIVVNPAGTAGSRFLSISFGFDIRSDALYAEFEDREQMVRDALITILSSKTVSQLTDAKQKEIMRYQIKKRLSQLLETEDIEAVYYTDFVLQ